MFKETPINKAVVADMDRFMSQKYERMSSYLQSPYDQANIA